MLAAAGWDDFPKRQAAARAQGRYLGIGLAHGVKGTGRGPFESGLVRISQTGKVTVFTGAAAMGQGLGTALAQIAAGELGVRAEDIKVVAGDTAGVSLGLGGFASRQTVTAGSSVHLAAQRGRRQGEEGRQPRAGSGRARPRTGRRRGARGRRAAAQRQARRDRAHPARARRATAFRPASSPASKPTSTARTDALAYANACHVAEVEVDVETGEVNILRYVALQDSGVLINPMMVEGQMHGGVAHGIGNALYEWMGYDDGGQPVTTTFADYLLPTATEVPMIDDALQGDAARRSIRSASRASARSGTIPAAAALISAVEDALTPFGVRIAQTPVTPAEAGRVDRRGRVGWVERSETQHCTACVPNVGSRKSSTQPTKPRNEAPSLMRTGSDYLRSLNDGRQVFVDGEKVADVTRHHGLPRGRALGGAALRHRGGAREPRAA